MRISRSLAALVIIGVLALVQAAGISPARAGVYDLACRYDHVTVNACLRFHQVPDLVNNLDVRAGLDVVMSEQYAREIVAHGAAFRASLWGDDNGRGQFLADLQLSPGWPVAGPAGLSAELSADSLWKVYLNEDAADDDEIYAVISYFDHHTGTTVPYRTGIVRGDFAPVFGPNPQCLVLC